MFAVDTDNWKKHVFKLVFLVILNYFKCDSIIVSSYDFGAHIILDFFNKIKTKKDIYYFVIGSTLNDNINKKNWNLKTYQNIKKIYVEAETLKNDLQKNGFNNVLLLNNFRYIQDYNSEYVNDGVMKFVFFARVIKNKGIEDAIKLVKMLNKNINKDIILDIYGQCDNDYLEKLKKSFTNKIKYCGCLVPNGKTEYEILSRYDALLFPTHCYNEGLPGTVIDAYVASLPIITSKWKNACQYLIDGKSGLIYEFDDFEDFYEKTLYFINSSNISEMKRYCKKISSKYDVNVVLENFKEDILKK